MSELPKLLRDFPPPWYVTPDGIKTERHGIWIMTGRPEMLTQIVELANSFPATPDKERKDLGDRKSDDLLEEIARQIACGMGPTDPMYYDSLWSDLPDENFQEDRKEGSWAYYHTDGRGKHHFRKIADIALSALSQARSAGPSKDERDAVIEECRKHLLDYGFEAAAASALSLKHSPKAGQEDAQ